MTAASAAEALSSKKGCNDEEGTDPVSFPQLEFLYIVEGRSNGLKLCDEF